MFTKDNLKKIRNNDKPLAKSDTYNDMKDLLSDPRFSHVAFDPRYRSIPKKETKIQIDERFKSAFTDEKFNNKAILDPRGKPKNYTTRETLDKFYDLPSSESEGENSEEDREEDEDESLEHIQVKRKEYSREEYLQSLLDPETNIARGETFYSDDSSDDDSSTTDEEEDEKKSAEFQWGELDVDAQWDTDGADVEETNRIAVCDMDWDQIKAVDLMVLFSSFTPPGGLVNRVSIYPSEFGKQRMKEEEISGPQELVSLGKKSQESSDYENLEKLKKGTLDENTAASSQQIEALRRYQRNRLRYFYAVVEFDSVETSRAIYKEVDRTHYEMAGINLDLRYIPSGMTFDEIPRDECHKVPETYDSEPFFTTALHDTKPTLTWDETDRRRKKVLSTTMAKALKNENYDDDMIKSYVASSDEEEDEEEQESEDEEVEGKMKESRIAKFRALIKEIEEKEKRKTELTFDKEEDFEVRGNESEESGIEEDEETKEDTKGLTPFERFLIKKKRKKEERRKKKTAIKDKSESETESEIGSDEANTQEINETVKESKKKKKKNKRNKKKGKDEPAQDSGPIDSRLALLVMDVEEQEKQHFDMRKIREEKSEAEKKKKKRKRAEEQEDLNAAGDDDFEVDTSDPRFAALFTHAGFNLDPSHPKYDHTSSLSAAVAQKVKRKFTSQIANSSYLDSDVSNLVKKIKLKTSKLK